MGSPIQDDPARRPLSIPLGPRGAAFDKSRPVPVQ